MLELKNISKSFKKKKVFNELNIKFPSKGFVSILGKSGSGKTTLLYLIAGFIKYDSGDIICDNLSYNSLDYEKINYFKNNYYGYIFQNDNLIDELTVYENIKLSMDINHNNNYDMIEDVLNKLGILDKKDELVCNLSGGELKRVSIARALCKGTNVLLCDEPTSSLDEENTRLIFNLLKEISKEKLVIVVSHDVDFSNEFSDEIFYLNYGKIVDHKIINKNDYEIKNIYIKKRKISLKLNNEISKRILSKQLLRTIFTVTFLVIFITIALFLSVYNSYNRTNVLYKALKNSNNDGYFITNIISSPPQKSTEEIDNEYKFDEYNITWNKYYSYDNFNLSYVTYSGDKFTKFFNYTIIDNNLNDYEIIITKYNYNILSEYIVNNTLIYNNIELYIKDILDLDNDIINDRVYLNEKTYNDLFYSTPNKYKATLNDSEEFEIVRRSFCTTIFDEYSCVGSTELKNNEILIGNGLYHYLTNTKFDSSKTFEENYKDVIDKEIAIKIFNNEYTFVIKGVCINSILYISDDIYDEVYRGDINIEDLNYGCFCKLGNKNDFKKFERYLFENEKYISFEKSSSLYIMSYSYDNIVAFFKIFFVVFAFIIALIIFYFIKAMINQNMKKIGILRTLGMSIKDISKIFLINFIKLYIVSFIISFLISLVLIIFENIWLRQDYDLNFNPISYNFIWVLVIFIISMIMIMLVFIYIFKSLKKKDDIEIIKSI